jgi:hypothetical protein
MDLNKLYGVGISIFDEIIKHFNLIKNMDEHCFYKKASESKIVFLILYVDNILLIGNDITIF